MFGLSRKILVILGTALALFLCLWWGISQYGKAQVATAKVEDTVKAVEIAQETRKVEIGVDVKAKAKRRATLDSVRSSGIIVENKIAEHAVQSGCDPDPEFDRVLNESIRTANSAIESARILSN